MFYGDILQTLDCSASDVHRAVLLSHRASLSDFLIAATSLYLLFRQYIERRLTSRSFKLLVDKIWTMLFVDC